MKFSRMVQASLLVALACASVIAPARADVTYKGFVSVVPNSVHVAGDQVFVMNAPAGGFTAQERALIIERNINNALIATTDRSPNCVEIVPINNLPVIRIGGSML